MKKTILILGGDGYYGWPLAMKIAVMYPKEKVVILDNEWRRNTVKSYGFQTLIPIAKPPQRIAAFSRIHKQNNLHYIRLDVNSDRLEEIIEMERPHTIFHLAQQCSAPYSMKGLEEALFTVHNNEEGNMRLLWAVRRHVPGAHIIKLGSFGEYAQGGIDIAEGYFFPRHKGIEATKRMPYPREADDIYHISKINDTNFVAMSCRVWNLRITDVMQSTIFGIRTEEMGDNEELYTRCDYDHIFGTVVNRFLTQTVYGHPLTVYGKGNQRTGLMALKDSVNSLVSFIEDVPTAGTHKVVNHVTETNFSINELAASIKEIAAGEGYEVQIIRTHDPRQEQVDTKPVYGIETGYSGHDTLHSSFAEVTRDMLHIIERFKPNISENLFIPSIKWADDITKDIKKPAAFEKGNFDDEIYWDIFRDKHFQIDRINLNPGTLGTTALPVKRSRNYQHPTKDPEGFPLGSYESGRKSLADISELCSELWPSDGYLLTVTHSTSQTMNLLALAMLRKLHQGPAGPYKLLTTIHEHEGGIGCFHHLPEFDIHYVEDDVLADDGALAKKVTELQPEVAFFSHVFYDTGNIAPVEQWCRILRENAPGCKIILDVAQSLGLFDIPFGCADIVLGSTHKWLFGPHGGGLMWMTTDFKEWIEAMYWSGHGLTHNPATISISIPGGQDFRLYPGITEALKFFKEAGKETALARSKYLGGYLQEKMDELFSANDLGHVFLNEDKESPVITIAFTDYNPYALYKYLNEQQVHVKCIMNHRIGHTIYHILRIGIPYFETMERLNFVLFEMGRYLTETNPVQQELALK
jgi:UDP-sulfoquinovose synthase